MATTMEIDDATRKSAREKAIARVAAELQQPDQLDRVEQIRFKYYNKKVSLETQLKNMVASQLKEASEGIEKLNASLAILEKVKKSAVSMYKLAAETQSLIPHYIVAQEVNIARINLMRTLNQLTSMLTIPAKVKSIQKLMDDDINILIVRREVRLLEKSRDAVLQQAKNHPEQQMQLKELFANVDQLVSQFENRVWQLLMDHMDLAEVRIMQLVKYGLPFLTAAQKRPEVLVKVLQVLNREDKRLEAEAAKAAKYVTESEGIEDIMIPPPGKYFQEALDRLYSHIRLRFWSKFESTRDDNGFFDVSKVIENTTYLVQDLEHVYDYVVPCFPPKYDILNLYVGVYHEALYQLFTEISKTAPQRDLSPQDTLNLVKWVRNFWTPQMARLGIEERKPDLLQALDMLIDEFKSRIYNLMEEWTNRIVSTDRESEPEIIDGIYYTLAPVTLFTFIHQQIEVARSTNTDLLVYVTADACRKIIELYQRLWTRKMEYYFNNVGSDTNPEIQYIIAHINNNSKCYDYLIELEENLAVLPDEYRTALQFEHMKDGFQSLLKLTRQVLAAYIFHDINDVFGKLFTKEWVTTGEQVEEIKETLEDYFSEVIRGHLLESYFKKFALECLEKVVQHYLVEMLSKKFTMNRNAIDRLNDDIEKLRLFFTNWEVKDKLVVSRIQILRDFVELFLSEPDAMGSLFRRMLENSPDLTQPIIEHALLLRDDLDRGQVKNVLARFKEIKERLPNREVPADGIFSTIGSRLK